MPPNRTPEAEQKSNPRRRLILFMMLMLFWFIQSGIIDWRQSITGVGASICTIMVYEWILRHAGVKEFPKLPKVKWGRFLGRLFLFIGESAWHHFKRIISGNEDVTFIHVTLDVTHPISRLMIANAITLAPGTVSVDLEKDVLKILCFSPKSDKEHESLYLMIDTLQGYFREDTPC